MATHTLIFNTNFQLHIGIGDRWENENANEKEQQFTFRRRLMSVRDMSLISIMRHVLPKQKLPTHTPEYCIMAIFNLRMHFKCNFPFSTAPKRGQPRPNKMQVIYLYALLAGRRAAGEPKRTEPNS